jgi:hypothetical protein
MSAAAMRDRTYTIAEGRGEWVIFDGDTGRRVTSFVHLVYAVTCVKALLDGVFDRSDFAALAAGEAGR